MLAGCGSGSAAAGHTGAKDSATALTVPTASVSAAQGAFQYTLQKGFFQPNTSS